MVAALAETGFPVGDIDLIVHGTTTTTNAVLERRLARTGMITTRGFRDVIELGRRTRPQPYGMTGVFVPVIPRDLRLEVSERVEAGGKVRMPLDEAEMRAAVAALLAAGCESLVIHFLHSYANPAHERRAAEIAAETLAERLHHHGPFAAFGGARVRARRHRRRQRLGAADPGALCRAAAATSLPSRGYARDFLIMNGNGGMISARFVTRESAKTVMSGPASGVIAAAYTGKRAGYENLVTYDMGGTSTDVALILNAEPAVSNETEIEYAMPIHVPMVAVHTVGAGGGSIARVDASGLIQVGPESAGAAPGPICYGRGGAEPTITDANLLLGRLDPKRLLAVDAPVTVEHVREIFAEKIGRAGRPRRDRRRRRGAEARQHEDGRRDPHGLGVARSRPPRFRAVRLRRRRPAACDRARPRARPAEGARSGTAGHHQCARLRGRRSPARFRQHAEPAGGDARRGTGRDRCWSGSGRTARR